MSVSMTFSSLLFGNNFGTCGSWRGRTRTKSFSSLLFGNNFGTQITHTRHLLHSLSVPSSSGTTSELIRWSPLRAD